MDTFNCPATLAAHFGVTHPRARNIGFPIGVPILGSLGFLLWLGFCSVTQSADYTLLQPAAFAHHIERFNAMDDEAVVNDIANKAARDWLRKNIPLFDCPDRAVEEIYYFRWWSFRKHLVRTPAGFVISEFLTPVSHAGKFNTISCAAGFHVTEGRWLRNERYVGDYIRAGEEIRRSFRHVLHLAQSDHAHRRREPLPGVHVRRYPSTG